MKELFLAVTLATAGGLNLAELNKGEPSKNVIQVQPTHVLMGDGYWRGYVYKFEGKTYILNLDGGIIEHKP